MKLKERWNNFKLWWKYPFIRPRTMTYDKYCSNFFSYTLLHSMPEGWLKAFSIDFCNDLKKALSGYTKDVRKSFRIYDIKEKYGYLRVSCNWYTPEIDEVIKKYEKISRKTCVHCGHKAKWLSKGYVLPFCKECAKRVHNHIKFTPIYRKGKKNGKNKNNR